MDVDCITCNKMKENGYPRPTCEQCGKPKLNGKELTITALLLEYMRSLILRDGMTGAWSINGEVFNIISNEIQVDDKLFFLKLTQEFYRNILEWKEEEEEEHG